jgi:hypothetical protein
MARRQRDSGNTGGVARFARDVGVNVAANLVTLAVVYVAGVVAGFFPRNAYLFVTAMFVVAMTVAVVVLAASHRLRGQARGYALGGGLVALGVPAALTPLAPELHLSAVDRWTYPVIGVAALVAGVITIVGVRKREITFDEPGEDDNAT